MKRIFGVAAVALALAAAGCGGSSRESDDGATTAGGSATDTATSAEAPPIPDGPITIGMPIAITGPISLFDADMLVGAQVAIDKLNASGGVAGHQLKLVKSDTTSDVGKGATAALDVIEAGADMLIPTLDYNFGGAAARVANEKKMIAISSAGDPRFGLAGIGPYMFNLYPGSPTEGASMAQFARSNLKWDTTYLLVDQLINHETETCAAVKEIFEELGGKVVEEDKFESNATSIATQATRMRAAQDKVDGIVLCSFPPGATAALKQLRGAGITKDILLDQAMDGNSWQEGLSDTSGLYAASVGVLTPGEEKDPRIAEVFDAATKLTGKPNNFSLGILTGYSAVEAYADAVAATKTLDAETIRKYLETFRDKPLAVGATTWTSTCHMAVGRPFTFVDFPDGKEQFVAKVQATKLPDPAC
jgi:branched-chain amino acid transport system substrate-binding protein